MELVQIVHTSRATSNRSWGAHHKSYSAARWLLKQDWCMNTDSDLPGSVSCRCGTGVELWLVSDLCHCSTYHEKVHFTTMIDRWKLLEDTLVCRPCGSIGQQMISTWPLDWRRPNAIHYIHCYHFCRYYISKQGTMRWTAYLIILLLHVSAWHKFESVNLRRRAHAGCITSHITTIDLLNLSERLTLTLTPQDTTYSG